MLIGGSLLTGSPELCDHNSKPDVCSSSACSTCKGKGLEAKLDARPYSLICCAVFCFALQFSCHCDSLFDNVSWVCTDVLMLNVEIQYKALFLLFTLMLSVCRNLVLSA